MKLLAIWSIHKDQVYFYVSTENENLKLVSFTLISTSMNYLRISLTKYMRIFAQEIIASKGIEKDQNSRRLCMIMG